ncbi:hypothetical protein P691DRAFT_787652 [Macrolepiota fuliginosa MF-IS2]|uniref:Uncharacterized protein n=1 Tax=Macrolepiota fuliginosa MF-IS2 TaxID=1400762 RepID=A0A9P5X5D9_9AGAR|nr:hypothetical protein P691DRAFT_787652 [Macrolepiota fuliginosa MF-IS2]
MQIDNYTLLSLSKLNHTLNHLTLDHFFINAHIDPQWGYIIAYLAPVLLLPALYNALWLNHLPSITYFLSLSIQRLFDEVYGLIRLIERVERNDTLDLRFGSTFDTDAMNESGHYGGPPMKIDLNVWVKMWVRLLEITLRKGCRLMKIEGEHWWLEMHYACHPMQVEDAAATGTGAMATSSPGLPPIPEEVSSFQILVPCLITLSLWSLVMMLGPIFPHTLNLIQNHTPILRHLKIIGIKIDRSIWEDFLLKLALPVLETFTYLVSISDMEFPIHLNANPKIISWLLQHSISCPNLCFVSLTSEYLSPVVPPKTKVSPYRAFDAGILTLANLAGPKTDTGADTPSQPPRQIHVQFKFNTEHSLLTWFLWHTHHESSLGSSSPICRLQTVLWLTISAHYCVRLKNYLVVLPEFLGLFPSLKWLEIIRLADAEAVATNNVFIRRVKEDVKGLERWNIDGVWVVGEKVEVGKEKVQGCLG